MDKGYLSRTAPYYRRMRRVGSGPLNRNAVIVVPGIMGSELRDVQTKRVLWGLSNVGWYAAAWTSGTALAELELTPSELDGRYHRVEATRLLRVPSFAPFLRGFEPYTYLLRAAQRASVHPAAVAEFPYDWRLPVLHNAGLLAAACRRHLEQWSKHPAQTEARRCDADGEPPRLIIVAHSMGGLLARALGLIDGGFDNVRRVVTIGTPFYGSAKAVLLLGTGTGAPLPREKLRQLALGLPGIYDLLPAYRCVDLGDGARRISAEDISSIGGSGKLAAASLEFHQALSGVTMPDHLQIVGAYQPTLQSILFSNGAVVGREYTCGLGRDGGIERIDVAGDGTVSRDASCLGTANVTALAQTHGAIAKSDETALIVEDLLTRDGRPGPWLGRAEVGLRLPDVVPPGRPFWIDITGVEHPTSVSCYLTDAQTGRQVAKPSVTRRNGYVAAKTAIASPGLVRVEVRGGGGASPVSQLVLVAPGGDASEADTND